MISENITERLGRLIHDELQHAPMKDWNDLKSASRSRYRKTAGRVLIYLRKVKWKA